VTAHQPVSVFDADLPTGLAFIRALGRAGVPVTAYHSSRSAMGRHSRFAGGFETSPPLADTDVFIDWLARELESGRIGLIAPTSDSVMYFAACAAVGRGGPELIGHPAPDAIFDSLLKHRFATALESAGFPTPKTATPTSIEQAEAFATEVGFPIVAKPRTHVGVGVERGEIIRDIDHLHRAFTPYEVSTGHRYAQAHDPDLHWPLLQEFIDVPDLEIVSVSGCLGPDGEVLAVDHSSKMRQWPPGLGIGTLFVAEEPQIFTDAAVRAVQDVLGTGIFEFEVLFDRSTDRYWGIDLNPRAFGQVALDIARGNNLPLHWYRSATGADLADPPTTTNRPTEWRLALPLAVDLLIELQRGENRRSSLADLGRLARGNGVGATSDWTDPLPSLQFQRSILRHPGGLVRPFL